MVVKIIFAFAVLALGIFLITRKHTIFKILGGLCLLLWLFLGDWGGLELVRKLFTFVKHNFILSLEILGGSIVATVLIGWLLSKVSPGKTTKHNSFANAREKTKDFEKKNTKTVYVVDGREFDTYQEAMNVAKQFHPDNYQMWITTRTR